MAYFNHAFHKSFVATKPTQSGASVTNLDNGIIAVADVHVSKLKEIAAPYVMGPGVVGLFDAKTNLSVLGADIASSKSPFYVAAAALKLNDKQGPYHGGYQESNKSKVINPKYIREVYKVEGNTASPAYLEIGETQSNTGTGGIVTVDTLVAGTTYVNGTYTDVALTTDGDGQGAIGTVVIAGTVLDSVTITTPGTGYAVDDAITFDAADVGGTGSGASVDVASVTALGGVCDTTFLCGETYYLRVEAKGTSALRFANHNLYRNLDASGGCCADPASPDPVNAIVIYKQWAEQVAEDPYLKDFIRPVLVADGQSYAYNAADAVALGLDPATKLYSDAPTAPTTSGIILQGAYEDTQFGTCTFTPTDYFGIEPVQLFASEVDLNGDPCTFSGVCVVEKCAGIQANGTGEQKVRDLILHESYLQNFMSSDLRIREITQGTRAYEVLDKTSIYSSFYILHSVPRFNNPSGTFDNDQYLLEIVGNDGTLTFLETQFDALLAIVPEVTVQDLSQNAASVCDYVIPTNV